MMYTNNNNIAVSFFFETDLFIFDPFPTGAGEGWTAYMEDEKLQQTNLLQSVSQHAPRPQEAGTLLHL